jgi:biotin operon repressor/anti-sigma regulatory factor (Ser/Thr protein kinase)
MAGARKRGEEIRQFILDQVEKHPTDIGKAVGETFGISRQAVNRHMQQLIAENLLTVEGATRNRRYSLKPLMQWEQRYPLDGSLEEDRVWRNDIAPRLGDLPKNVLDIWHYGFTEMLNNAIDHSSGTFVEISLTRTAANTNIILRDDGEGIFKKIQREMKLDDERHALLELAKGKLTTDPSRHSGEGIFFSSRAFDLFEILSGDIYFSHQIDQAEDWIDDGAAGLIKGTWIVMTLSNHASHILKDIFDRFTSGEDFGFTKTIVPVYLAQYGDEMLVSRSQAKRLLARIEKFKTVLLDFAGVSAIGQAFADEIFRVFAKIHPNIELIPINTNPDVQKMISRALHHED